MKNIIFPNVLGFGKLKKLILLCLISVSFINFESSRYRMKLCICGETVETISELFKSIYNFENSRIVLKSLFLSLRKKKIKTF